MAEVFGVVVSAFTVVEIAGKLGSSTIKLKKLWDEVQEVPSEMNQLVGMVDILNATLTELDRAFDKAGDPNFGTLDVSLNWCQQAATDLDTLATDLQQQIATAKRFRRRITKLKVTFKKDLIRSCEQKIAVSWERLSIVHHLLSMGFNLSDLRDHDSLLQFEGFVDGPNDVLELFKIWIYVALDDSLEEYCAPGETTMNLSAISSFVWNAPEALQYMKRSLLVTANQFPSTARFAHLDWSLINPQILLEDIQHDKDLQPEEFCATIEKSQASSLGHFASQYRIYIEGDENWRGLARWIFKGASLERLSMPGSLYARGGGRYTPLFIGIFDLPWKYNLGLRTHRFLRTWLEDLQTSGIDLEEYGRREMEIFKRDALLQDRRSRVRSTRDDGYYESYPGMRLTSFTYGPEPEDWKLVWSPEAEEYAGEFWDLIENPPLRIPGGWVDDDM
ncbi:hypothetical protein SGCOL_004536 [Colletotrichum sp. CLE4]